MQLIYARNTNVMCFQLRQKLRTQKRTKADENVYYVFPPLEVFDKHVHNYIELLLGSFHNKQQ